MPLEVRNSPNVLKIVLYSNFKICHMIQEERKKFIPNHGHLLIWVELTMSSSQFITTISLSNQLSVVTSVNCLKLAMYMVILIVRWNALIHFIIPWTTFTVLWRVSVMDKFMNFVMKESMIRSLELCKSLKMAENYCRKLWNHCNLTIAIDFFHSYIYIYIWSLLISHNLFWFNSDPILIFHVYQMQILVATDNPSQVTH